MGNADSTLAPALHPRMSSDQTSFDYGPYVKEDISLQDVVNIKQAFESLRDEYDRPNEVKMSKLKMFPFFNKSDLSRFPRESERILNQMREGEDFSYEEYNNKDESQQDKYKIQSNNMHSGS